MQCADLVVMMLRFQVSFQDNQIPSHSPLYRVNQKRFHRTPLNAVHSEIH